MSDPTAPRSPLSVLKHRNYALYWSGQTVSMIGTWMQVMAQSWVVVTFTDKASALGFLQFASALPMMILTLYGGVAADRMDKRRILIAAQFALMMLAFTLAALYGYGRLQLWHLFVLAACSGVAAAYEMPANQALTPELVEPEEIPQAIALNNSSFHGSRIIGPAIAGYIIAAWGIVGAFIANGLSFVAVILSLLFIHSHRSPQHPHAHTGSPWQSMKEGLRYVRERPRLLILMSFSVLITFLVFPNLIVLLPLYAKDVLKLDSRGFSYLMSSSGLGAMLGSLLLLAASKEGRNLRIGLGLCGVTLALIILALSHNLYLSCAAIFLNSLSFSTMVGLSNTIIQEVVPGHLRGRVMSLNTLTFVGIMPFTSLIMAALAEVTGLRNEILVCGILYGVCSFFLFRKFLASPEIHDFEEPSVQGMVPATGE